ncbi:MAG: VanW family protein [Candidatus Saganbacteria bacterium]|uniref:VanW family protein n=1 Tax=Candidatus Saganbacteria bacterium TaxID=2575572 RepID=A0A833P333_UNCSA|nr:MAG: VanW family protein [Candidatus Saganbacteria bacterium]
MNNYFGLLKKTLIAVALFSISAAAIFLAVDFFKSKDAFPPKTYICKIDISSLNKEDAKTKLRQTPIFKLLSFPVIFQSANETFTFSPEELGVSVLVDETIDSAFDLTHNKNYFKDLKTRLSTFKTILPAKFTLDEFLARDILSEVAQNIDSPAKDAGIVFYEETGGYNILPEHSARTLKIDETISAAKSSLAEGNFTVPLIINYSDQPRITEKVLRSAPPVFRLSAYTTFYGSHDSPNRIHNIKLIASWVDNTILLADEVFSLTEKIGSFTPERGFKEAYVILGGALVPQLGGGTCQIGTTLFNAVSLADFEIISRRNHSFYFNIYPLGRDAAVYPGQVDVKFKNNTGHPILIKTIANNKQLSFRIFGTPTGKTVDFSPPSIYILDYSGSFRPSTLREVIASDRPFRTTVVRTVKDSSGKQIKEEFIRSYYKLYGEKTNVPIRRREPR